MKRVAPHSARSALALPAALAPEPGAAQLIGEVSEPAERFGLRAGMRMGEALSRCPELALIPPDPERAERSWEEALRRLEGIGAQVESARAGEAFFEAGGLSRLWGGIEGVLKRMRQQLGRSVCLGAGPGRFCAYVAAASSGGIVPRRCRRGLSRAAARIPALRAPRWPRRGRRPPQRARAARDLHPRAARGAAARCGRRPLRAPWPAGAGAGARRGRSASPATGARGDRGGARAARGCLRAAAREGAGAADLPPARPRRRRGRKLRTLRLSARLAAGGGWRRQVALRRASADRSRLADALIPHLTLLPAPAATLRLEAVALGPETGDQLSLSAPDEERRKRISEAVRQTRSAAGADSLMRVLEVDPGSRVPERREVLMPFPEEP